MLSSKFHSQFLRHRPKLQIETRTTDKSRTIHLHQTGVVVVVAQDNHKQDKSSNSSLRTPRCYTGLVIPISLASRWIEQSRSSSIRIVGSECVRRRVVDS